MSLPGAALAQKSNSFVPTGYPNQIKERITMLKSIVSFTLALAIAGIAAAQEPESLFDGKSLEHWKVIGCQVKVVDGAILAEDGNGIILADKEYGDYIFECKWKALAEDNWDSGIYFRCEMPPEGRPWPKQYQINMLKGQEGSLPGVKETITELYKPGDWNSYKLTVRGKVAELEFNGKKAWTYDGIETLKGHLCLQAEVPKGGQFLFKDLTIVDLDKEKKGKK